MMILINDQKTIQYPNCNVCIAVEDVNANPEAKKQAMEQGFGLWGEDVYDRNYLLQNVVFCPSCNKVRHFKDWDSDSSKK